MRVIKTYIVKGIHGEATVLLECEGNRFYLMRNGPLDRNDSKFIDITPVHAKRLIDYDKTWTENTN
jgi:hypothetical protein